MRTRHQQGYVYKHKSGWWCVRYYDNVMQKGGVVKRTQRSQRIAPVCDLYRTRRSVMPLVQEFLAPVNAGTLTPESTTTVERFVDDTYLPWVEQQKRPSTFDGYRKLWRKYLKGYCAAFQMRGFRTCDGERMLAEVARQNALNRTSLKHVKSFLSGVFTHAKRIGVLNGSNPVQGVSIPKAREAGETYAYSLEEIVKGLAVLPIEAAAPVACAAFGGFSRSELRGLDWQDYSGAEIRVHQAVWRSHVHGTKTRARAASVPVIAQLASVLNQYRSSRGNPANGFLFVNSNGMPLDLDALAARVIRPQFEAVGLKWHGWHAFRRGLATNLYRLGVPDKVIQGILRHANVATTMNNYVKSVSEDAVAAMRTLEANMHQYAPKNGEYAPEPVVN